MQKRISEAITELGEQIGLDTTVITAHKERVRRWTNDIREQIGELPYDLSALQFELQLRTFRSVTANVTVSTGALTTEATGSGSAFTTDLVEPYSTWVMLYEGREYQIDNVQSATVLTLRAGYIGSSSSSGAATFYRKYNPIPFMVNRLVLVKDQGQELDLPHIPVNESESYFPSHSIEGYLPEGYHIWGNQEIGVTKEYMDVGGNADSYTASAVATANFYSDGVTPGTLFQVSSTAFTVKRILTPNRLLLEQSISSSIGSNGSATAINQNRVFMTFLPVYASAGLFNLKGLKKVSPLYNDDDWIEDGWWSAVRAGVIVRGYEYLKRPIGEKQALYQAALQNLIREQRLAESRFGRIRPKMNPGRYSGYF